jgi:Domain of unknown function (DUF4272)
MSTHSLNPHGLRRASKLYLANLGVASPDVLPLLEPGSGHCTTPSAVGSRLLILHALASLAFDLSRRSAVQDWLSVFGLHGQLTSAERQFLEGSSTVPAERFQWYSESCLALSWVAGVVDLDVVGAPEPEDMVFRLPGIKRMEDPESFLSGLRVRGLAEIAGALDTLYCLHWAIRQAHIDGKQLYLPNHSTAFVERRYALEWVITCNPWDAVTLNT